MTSFQQQTETEKDKNSNVIIAQSKHGYTNRCTVTYTFSLAQTKKTPKKQGNCLL